MLNTESTLSSSAKYLALALATLLATPAFAEGNYYIKPHLGLSTVQDNDLAQAGVATPGAEGDGSYDTGFATGVAFGYRYGNGWSAEIDWEYRSNDNDEVSFTDGTRFDDGDIASNVFYVNGYYTFEEAFGRLRPYVGAGLGWVQEIDLDLESGGIETSYSGDGDIAWQLMVGAEADIAENWRIQGGLRYGRITGVDLAAENGAGKIKDLDYETWTVGVGVVYDF